VFHFGELRRLIVAENIVNAYRDRSQSQNWAQWTSQNMGMAELLAEAEKLWQKQNQS